MSANGGLLVVPAAPALVKLSEDEEYRRALVSADMAIADSGAMVLLCKIFTGRSVERISGLKFLKRLVARLGSHPDERVLWIVPSEHAHEKTIAWLRSVNLTASADFYIAPRYVAQVRDDPLVAKIDNHPPVHVVIGIGGGVQTIMEPLSNKCAINGRPVHGFGGCGNGGIHAVEGARPHAAQ